MKAKTLPTWVVLSFFSIGLVSSVLFRLILFLNYIDIFYSRIAWYCGVIGYILFFSYRFFISLRRRKMIQNNNLIKILEDSNIDEEHKKEIKYILNSIIKSKEMINYIFIFVSSGIAIIVDIILSFMNM